MSAIGSTSFELKSCQSAKKIAQVSSYADDDEGNNNGVCPREIIIMSVFVNIMHIRALHARLFCFRT